MRLNHLMFGLACLVAPLAACGDDGGGSLTAGGFLTQFGDVYCGTAFECEPSFPTNLGVTHEDVFGADIAACKSRLITSDQLQASVDAGRVTFNATAAGTCISKLDAFDCPGFWTALTSTNGFPAECDAATVGTVQTGGTCTINLDCVSVSCSTGGTCNAPE